MVVLVVKKLQIKTKLVVFSLKGTIVPSVSMYFSVVMAAMLEFLNKILT